MICNSTFKVGYMGVVAIKQHKTSGSHKSNCNVSASNSLIDKFFVKANTKEEDNVIASELTHIYHAVKHNHSYNSLDCSLKLNSKLYQDSKVAGKISCGRTKSEAIVTNVLGKKALEIALKDLKQHDPPLYFCLQIDASNHKNRKMFPVCVQYFNIEYGAVNYMIDFLENADESADGMFTCLRKTMDNLQLDWDRVSCFSADNANCNFGVKHSLYTNILTLNDSVVKANCNAHILHNSVKSAMGNLNVDVENIVLKIYGHFSVSAKRRETLKDFHSFVKTEYREILRHVPTRWLSLQPCIERILLSWKALSSYFLSRPTDCSKQLYKLLSIDDDSTEIPRIIEIYLMFSQHVMEVFQLSIKELEKTETTAVDISNIMAELRNKLRSRYVEEFFGYQVQQQLKNLGSNEAQKIVEDFKSFLTSAITYLENRIDFDENSVFGKLSNLSFLGGSFPNFKKFVEVVEYLKLEGKLELKMDELFDEVALTQRNFDTIKNSELFISSKTTSRKWHLILKSVDFKCINVFKIVSFALSIPGTSVYCERVFSLMSSKWRDERNRCSVELIKNELFIYFNIKDSCLEFAKNIKEDRNFLKAAKSQAKYSFKQ